MITTSKKIFLSILAGAAIAFGGLTYLFLKSVTSVILASFCFSIGLIIVLVFSLWLFTGKIGYAFDKKFSVLDFIIMFFGNFLGAVTIGYIAYFVLKDTNMYVINLNASISKLDNFNFVNLLLSGIACGGFVYAAVEAYKFKKLNIILRIILVVAFIGTFVYLSLNHCVANMFYFSFASCWSFRALLFILVNTLGNSIGAIILNIIKNLVVNLVNKKQ